jgi:hypothetical protein
VRALRDCHRRQNCAPAGCSPVRASQWPTECSFGTARWEPDFHCDSRLAALVGSVEPSGMSDSVEQVAMVAGSRQPAEDSKRGLAPRTQSGTDS